MTVNAAGHRRSTPPATFGQRRRQPVNGGGRRWRTTVDCHWTTVDHHRTTGQRDCSCSKGSAEDKILVPKPPENCARDCSCSKGSVEDKILVPKPLENCARYAKCGHPFNGPYCQGCTLLREKLEEDLVTYFQKFQNTSESSDGSTNVVNAPREPFVVKQDHGVNPTHIDECCCECGEALDGIICQRCACKSCGKGAHIGYNCPPTVPIISNPELCNQTMNNDPPQTLRFKEISVPCVSKPNFDDESSNIFIPPPQPPIYSCEFCGSNAQYGHYCTPQAPFINPEPVIPTEPVDSLNMGDEHLDTIPATKSDEFIKSCVGNLVPNPSESKGENGCDVPTGFTTFSNVLFDDDYDSDSSDDQSLSDEDIDSLFDDFAGELTLLKSIPSGIDETDCQPEKEIRLTKRLLYDNSSPRPPEEIVSDNSNADIESFSPSPIPNLDNYLTKFDPKSYEGVFLGYSQKHTIKIKESLNMTFDETPPPSKTSPLVDDDLDEDEAIKVTKKKNLENDIEDETLEVDKIVNIKESKSHPLGNIIGNLNQRTLMSQAQNQRTKWVYRNKLDENGVVSRNKAMLVSQGYNLQVGIDYDETYASVARLESIRILLAYVCALHFKLFQMDVKSEFLNGFINEE
nr:hypothetical protein [Tanacetum cinerariifolium]